MFGFQHPLAPAFVVAVGAFFVTFGGFWAAKRQSNFNAELREKNEEIARLQQENAGAITGGDSFCWMALQVVGLNGELVNANSMPDDLILIPNFIHKGKYPLYDVSARIIDIDEWKKNITQAMQTTKTVSIGNMTPGFWTTTPIRLTHHGKDFNFNIFYVARNGSWLQKLRMRWVGDGWASASRVAEGLGGGKELLQEVSANYPRGDNGNVDWDTTP
jgi:hypothetical protein